jgi:tetratricopeptide (TPR) repeat protein
MNLSIGRRTGALALPSVSALLFVLPLLLPLALRAQSLPAPKEFYFDGSGATTQPLVLLPGSDAAVQERLLKAMKGHGRNAELATAQLAHIAYASGRADAGGALYARVLADIGNNSQLRAPLLWNHGWDLYRSGDAEGALARWREAGIETYNNPGWVPPTLALGLWALGRRDEAVQWYAAAVRTEPQRWSDPANLAALLPDWNDAERATLAEVAAAWRAAPPIWP